MLSKLGLCAADRYPFQIHGLTTTQEAATTERRRNILVPIRHNIPPSPHDSGELLKFPPLHFQATLVKVVVSSETIVGSRARVQIEFKQDDIACLLPRLQQCEERLQLRLQKQPTCTRGDRSYKCGPCPSSVDEGRGSRHAWLDGTKTPHLERFTRYSAQSFGPLVPGFFGPSIPIW